MTGIEPQDIVAHHAATVLEMRFLLLVFVGQTGSIIRLGSRHRIEG